MFKIGYIEHIIYLYEPLPSLCDNFVSALWQVGGFLRVLRFPLPIKLTATI